MKKWTMLAFFSRGIIKGTGSTYGVHDVTPILLAVKVSFRLHAKYK